MEGEIIGLKKMDGNFYPPVYGRTVYTFNLAENTGNARLRGLNCVCTKSA